MRTYEQIEKMFSEKGFKFFKGNLNINLFAIRKHVNTNVFDDEFFIAYEEDGQKKVISYPCTTESGKFYLNSPMNPKGTAIMVPGQYRSAYSFGMHQGKYECLRQEKAIKYWRDNDKDGEHDLSGKVYEEIAYTNIHHAGVDSKSVDKWSAGCIVFKNLANFNSMMELAHKSAKVYGDKFTFTLIDEHLVEGN
jgi:hypothetical protein